MDANNSQATERSSLTIFAVLSGADSSILKRVPEVDRKPYIRIGILNLTIGLLFTFACYQILRIVFNFSIVWIIFICYLLFFWVTIFFQKIITQKLINKESSESKFLFSLAGTLIYLIVGLALLLNFSNSRRINNVEKIGKIYNSLNNYNSTINEQRDKGISDFRFSEYYRLKDEEGYLNYMDSCFSNYLKFIDLTRSKLPLLPLKDTSEVSEKVRDLNYKILRLYNKTVYYVADTGYGDKYFYDRIYAGKSSLKSLYAIPASDFRDIASYFNPNLYQSLSLNEKFGVLFSFTNATTISLSLIIVTVSIIALFYPIYFTVKTHKNDFYQRLLQEKEKLTTEELEKQRKRISEIYKTQLDIRQTKQALEQASTSKDIDQQRVYDLLDKLKEDYTSVNLATLADIENEQGNSEKALEYINKAIELDAESSELWKKKADILTLLERKSEAESALKRYNEIVRKTNFSENLSRIIYIKGVETKDISFYGSFKWELTNNINILLGKNGYGKSHLLTIIAALLQDDEDHLKEFKLINNRSTDKVNSGRSNVKILLSSSVNDEKINVLTQSIKSKQNEIINITNEIKNKKVDDKEKSNANKRIIELNDEITKIFDEIEVLRGRALYNHLEEIQSTFGKISMLAIPDSRFINKSTRYTLPVIDDQSKKLLEFGAYHFIKQAPYEQAIQNFLNTICNIYQNTKSFNAEIFKLVNRVFRQLTGNELEWCEIKPSEDNSGFSIMVKTEGNSDCLPIQKVSQGTISILSIFGLIYNYLSLRYSSKVEDAQLCKQHAIIFIDEIDAHLHPSWQQKIIGILKDEFPNIQFIISAHSPLVVAGCKEGEVSVLRKENTGFTIETIDRNLIGLPIADIFQLVFEIEEKDETYLELCALLPFKNVIEERLKALGEKSNRNSEEELELEELKSQAANFKYLDQVNTLRSSKDQFEELKLNYKAKEMENVELKAEKEFLDEENKQLKSSKP